MFQKLWDQLIETVLDKEGASPRTELQAKLAGYAAISMNFATAITFVTLFSSIAIAVMFHLTEALQLDVSGLGTLVTLVGTIVAIGGGLMALHSVLEISRYQIFAFIGVFSLAQSFYEHIGDVIRGSTDPSIGDFLGAVWRLVKGFVLGGG